MIKNHKLDNTIKELMTNSINKHISKLTNPSVPQYLSNFAIEDFEQKHNKNMQDLQSKLDVFKELWQADLFTKEKLNHLQLDILKNNVITCLKYIIDPTNNLSISLSNNPTHNNSLTKKTITNMCGIVNNLEPDFYTTTITSEKINLSFGDTYGIVKYIFSVMPQKQRDLLKTDYLTKEILLNFSLIKDINNIQALFPNDNITPLTILQHSLQYVTEQSKLDILPQLYKDTSININTDIYDHLTLTELEYLQSNIPKIPTHKINNNFRTNSLTYIEKIIIQKQTLQNTLKKPTKTPKI